MLLSLENVTFGYTDVPLLEDVSFAIHEKERVGLLGPNGEGKTTLLKLILGELSPDKGEIFLKNGIRVGYLEQTSDFSSSLSVYDGMREVFREDELLIEQLRAVEGEFASATEEERRVLSARMESLNRRIAARDSYHTDVRIRTVLTGMGFEGRYDQSISTMSGGEKTRLKLSRLLLEEPDLLILDEPTNHLDVKTLFWLEEYLTSFKGALLIVSHDRYFLDKLTERTLELSDRTIVSYKGNYAKYKILREERYREQLQAYEAQQEEIAKLSEYVAKNGVRATTAKSAKSRENRLERMTLLKKPTPPPSPPRFSFTFEERPREKVVEAPHFDLCVQGRTLLKNASFTLFRGDKCALTGENGTGKSTLLKFLLKESDQVTHGLYAKFGYYDQEQTELDPSDTVLGGFWGENSLLSRTEVQAALARCGLSGEDVGKRVSELSGGQLAKLKLCLLEAKHANVLFLDEPTNHLDLPARESLEESLRAFEGTLLFVSHDRRFIEAVANKIAVIENGTLSLFQGDYQSFLASRPTQPQKVKTGSEKKPPDGYRTKEDRAAEARKKEKMREIEKKLEALELEEAENNEKLVELASDYREVQKISLRQSELQTEIEHLYAEYEKYL